MAPYKEASPSHDTSLGLIYRLNSLWNRADYAAQNGDYVKWDVILDTIWRNLLYSDNLNVLEDKKTKKIKEVKLSEEDTQIVEYHNLRISKCKKNFKNARTLKERNMFRSRWYHALQQKDISIRKFMQTLKLYLKVNKRSPGNSAFGDF